MTKTELVETIASQCELSKAKAYEVVSTLFETVSKTMCDGEPVRITGFGTFEPRPRKSRAFINPLTKQRIMRPAKVIPGFRPASALKELMGKKLKVVESAGQTSIVKAVR
ncbi:MAG: HU family DNA-binding protein [Candidatus Caldarchaeum sp.]